MNANQTKKPSRIKTIFSESDPESGGDKSMSVREMNEGKWVREEEILRDSVNKSDYTARD